MATNLRIQTLCGTIVQHEEFKLSFRFRVGDGAPAASAAFETGLPGTSSRPGPSYSARYLLACMPLPSAASLAHDVCVCVCVCDGLDLWCHQNGIRKLL